jgi:hypothetical protein
MINMAPEDVAFEIQDGPARRWACVIDTAQDPANDIRRAGSDSALWARSYWVRGRSIAVFVTE